MATREYIRLYKSISKQKLNNYKLNKNNSVFLYKFKMKRIQQLMEMSHKLVLTSSLKNRDVFLQLLWFNMKIGTYHITKYVGYFGGTQDILQQIYNLVPTTALENPNHIFWKSQFYYHYCDLPIFFITQFRCPSKENLVISSVPPYKLFYTAYWLEDKMSYIRTARAKKRLRKYKK